MTILILTALDLACTAIGLSMGVITEANPILARMYDWSLIGTCVITFLVVALFVWVISRSNKPWVKCAVRGLIVVKVAVMLLHCVWIFTL